MLLAIDVGNTNLTLGLYCVSEGCPTTLLHQWRLETVHTRTADEYGLHIRQLLQSVDIAKERIGQVILASVVPILNRSLSQMAETTFGKPAMVVGPGLKTGMPILYHPPQDVGADRIVNAVAAYHRYQSACIVVDFGTATTFDSITAKGEYAGGAIVPGIQVSMNALFHKAARLPKVDIDRPPSVIGKSTVHAIQAGLYYGYAALVDGLVERMKAEMASPPTHVIATGGLARVVKEASVSLEAVDEELTLEGLRLIYLRNRPQIVMTH